MILYMSKQTIDLPLGKPRSAMLLLLLKRSQLPPINRHTATPLVRIKSSPSLMYSSVGSSAIKGS